MVLHPGVDDHARLSLRSIDVLDNDLPRGPVSRIVGISVASPVGVPGADLIDDGVPRRGGDTGEGVRRGPAFDGLDFVALRIELGGVADGNSDEVGTIERRPPAAPD